jgi:hypothetical protein
MKMLQKGGSDDAELIRAGLIKSIMDFRIEHTLFVEEIGELITTESINPETGEKWTIEQLLEIERQDIIEVINLMKDHDISDTNPDTGKLWSKDELTNMLKELERQSIIAVYNERFPNYQITTETTNPQTGQLLSKQLIQELILRFGQKVQDINPLNYLITKANSTRI